MHVVFHEKQNLTQDFVFFHSRLLLLIIQVTHDHLFSFRWKRVAIFAPRPHTAHVN